MSDPSQLREPVIPALPGLLQATIPKIRRPR